MHTLDMHNVYLQTYRNNRIRKKVAYFLRKIQTSGANNSRILRIQNAEFSGYYFYMNTNIWRDFQICINAPLKRMRNAMHCNSRDDLPHLSFTLKISIFSQTYI